MELANGPIKMTAQNGEISATVLRERSKLGSFIRRRVSDPAEAEDILQDVLSEFVEACRLPEPIERASAWLFRSARNRIVDFFRRRATRRSVLATTDIESALPRQDEEHLELLLPSADERPEAAYWRSVVMAELQRALDELPAEQREVFEANELGGVSFKMMAAQSGLPVNTLLARKRYAVLHLRKRLQWIYDELEM